MNSITQDQKYRQSLMKYCEKYGVSRASRKYNRPRSYIYYWKKRYDGTIESLACQSRRPHSHPNQHTEEELALIRKLRKRNPRLGIIELWHRLKNAATKEHWKACGAYCGVKDWKFSQSRKRNTSRNHTSRCSIRGSEYRLMSR